MTITLPTVHVSADDLQAVLDPILPLAARDPDAFPVLTAVSLSVRQGWLVASATDRYRVGWCRHRLDPDLPQPVSWDALVPAADLVRLLRVVRPNYRDTAQLALTVDSVEQTMTVRQDGTSNFYADLQITVRLQFGTYPNLAPLFEQLVGARMLADRPLVLRAALLAGFRHAERDRAPLVIWSGPGRKGVGVACGDHFIGALMPLKLSGVNTDDAEAERVDLTADWAPLLTPASAHTSADASTVGADAKVGASA